eukprot:CAMPEP_0170142538 /NCGR_PEP_ID=MMETSP0033_2-20121228/7696_1 /TAXON_ID=195969 /ORGANISM="Dolichomastix tenuilepis, Strain CCMP3274" /LENGTH=131 /DNA_ID=CAMNT_0010378875 /DNA_START=50 /DNA_END=441 /DNA_ORIENTATION=-
MVLSSLSGGSRRAPERLRGTQDGGCGRRRTAGASEPGPFPSQALQQSANRLRGRDAGRCAASRVGAANPKPRAQHPPLSPAGRKPAGRSCVTPLCPMAPCAARAAPHIAEAFRHVSARRERHSSARAARAL